MARKKIIFVIVEGPSDEDAIGVLLNRIYDRNRVYVYVVHGDVTAELSASTENIVAKVGTLVRKYAGRIFKQSDFCRIIHIADTDGAYIPNDCVIEDKKVDHAIYSDTEIRTNNKRGIEERNRRKRENMNRLASVSEIWKIPYRIYYMSCNLDHALYGKRNSTDAEKESDAFAFAERYKDDLSSFLRFIAKSEFSVIGGYAQSWKFIREDLHSLQRHTNFGECFTDLTSSQTDKDL